MATIGSNGLARRVWDLHRFGLTPRKLAVRIWNRPAPRVLVVSLPKAGTHLVERALCLHPRLYRRLQRTVTEALLPGFGGLETVLNRLGRGQIAVSHLGYDAERSEILRRSGARAVFIVRDPRDIAVSLAHYVVREKAHPHHELFTQLPTFVDRYRLAIEGAPERGLQSMPDRLQHFSGWLSEDLLLLRFEELVGARGGGSATTQRRVIVELFDFLGVARSEPIVISVQERLFSDASPTFRRGLTGQWREEFTPDLVALARERLGESLRRYGYDNW